MKIIVALLCCLFLNSASAQHLDSLHTPQQLLELKISNPQPRLGETFEVSVDVHQLKANVFRSLIGKVELAPQYDGNDKGELTLRIKRSKTGSNILGPLDFFLGETKYTTNSINYETIEALPDTNEGLWIRKVKSGDSAFYIIIEQRIPATTVVEQKEDHSTNYTAKADHNNIVKFKDNYSINGASSRNSTSTTDFSSVTSKGEEKEFFRSYSIYYFEISNKKTRIKITADKFQNLPKDYQFNDLLVQ